MRRNDISIIHPVLLVTYAFLSLPLAYDLLFGRPSLVAFPGFHLANGDTATSGIYLAYVAGIFPLLYVAAKLGVRAAPEMNTSRDAFYLAPPLRFACHLLLYSPLMLALIGPAPSVYLEYAISFSENYSYAVAQHHALVAIAGQAAIVAAVALLLSAKRVSPGLIINVLAAMAATAWLSGKRAIVAMILVGLVYALWQRGYLRGRRLIALGAISLLALGLFSNSYQSTVRGDSVGAASYEVFRIDYGRDNQIRMSIYAEQHPSVVQILPNRGETLPLYLAQLVPSSLWTDKPMPYSQYFTSALYHSPPRLWGWGMTTSWYEEWVSNIGISGFFVAPVLLGLLCRWADKAKQALPRAGLTVILILLVVLEVAAFSFLIPVTLLLVFWERVSRKRQRQAPVSTARLNSGRRSNPIP